MENVTGRISNLEQLVHRIDQKFDESARSTGQQLREIATSMQMMVRMEERQQAINLRLADGSRAMEEMRERLTELEKGMPKRADSRLGELEREMPPLKETRHDIRKLNWLVLAAVIVALLALVVGGKA